MSERRNKLNALADDYLRKKKYAVTEYPQNKSVKVTKAKESESRPVESKPVPKDKKKKSDEIDESAMYPGSVVKELQQQAEDLLERFKNLVTVQNKEEEERDIQQLQFSGDNSFIVLPKLGYVVHPMFANQTNPPTVRVGSMLWLKTIDMLYAHGWPQAGIDKFLDESAKVVLRDANHDCYGRDPSGQKMRLNRVIDFCMWWPHSSKQKARLITGIDKLIDGIRAAYAPENPFEPANLDEIRKKKKKDPNAEVVAVPKKIAIRIGNAVLDDILENWTVAVEKYTNLSTKSTTWECVPSGGVGYYSNKWIPQRYRSIVENAFDITPFYYCDPVLFRDTYFTLMDRKSDNVQINPESKKWYINMAVNDGIYEVSRAFIKMNEKPCSNLLQDKKAQYSLRQVCGVHNVIHYMPELYYVLLNVEPKMDNPWFEKHPEAWKKLTYRTMSGGKNYQRMYADAPFALFREYLIREYSEPITDTESAEESFQKFLKNVWRACRMADSRKDTPNQLPKEAPIAYRDMIRNIWSLGGQYDIPEFLKPKDKNMEIMAPAAGYLSKEEISKMTMAMKKQTFKDLTDFLLKNCC